MEQKKEFARLQEVEALFEKEKSLAKERESSLIQSAKLLKSEVEKAHSERDQAKEQEKSLLFALKDKDATIATMKLDTESLKTQLAHSEHEKSSTARELRDSQAEVQRRRDREGHLQDRLPKVQRQVDDVNRQLTNRIAEIAVLQKAIENKDKEIREQKRSIEQVHCAIQKTQDEMKSTQAENKNMKNALRFSEATMKSMKIQMEKDLRDRELMVALMTKKTDENEFLGIEVATLKATIERGESMYNERLEDTRLLKNEISSLRQQCHVLKLALQNTTDTRHEVLQLHRELNQRSVRAKVLEQEMLSPLNIHRWKMLEAANPAKAQRIKKLQRCQRRALVLSTRNFKLEEIVKSLATKTQQLEIDLKNARQPVAEAQKKLMIARVSATRLIAFTRLTDSNCSRNSQQTQNE